MPIPGPIATALRVFAKSFNEEYAELPRVKASVSGIGTVMASSNLDSRVGLTDFGVAMDTNPAPIRSAALPYRCVK